MIGATLRTAQIRSSSAILGACLLMGVAFLIARLSSDSSDSNIRSIPTIATHSNNSLAVEIASRKRKDVSISTFGVYPAEKLAESSKRFNPGTYQPEIGLKINTNNQRRVVHQFENATKPWVLRSGTNAVTASAIRHSRIEIDNAQTLKNLKSSGFLSAGDQEDQLVCDGMAKSQAFFSENNGDKKLVSP